MAVSLVNLSKYVSPEIPSKKDSTLRHVVANWVTDGRTDIAKLRPPEGKILNKPFNYLNLFESKAPKHLRAAVPAEVLNYPSLSLRLLGNARLSFAHPSLILLSDLNLP